MGVNENVRMFPAEEDWSRESVAWWRGQSGVNDILHCKHEGGSRFISYFFLKYFFVCFCFLNLLAVEFKNEKNLVEY